MNLTDKKCIERVLELLTKHQPHGHQPNNTELTVIELLQNQIKK